MYIGEELFYSFDVLPFKIYNIIPPFLSSIPVCHTASSPIPFPPSVTSFVSSMASELHPSLPSMPLEALSSRETDVLKLLPPFLSDQGQLVHVHGTFHLFCHGTGEYEMGWSIRKSVMDHITFEVTWRGLYDRKYSKLPSFPEP
ncbi:unnamed protein product [Ranitomeya imitator]|uniref:Uncharacterized protein n=1 Tax=Ranitomeya imitator TaxID=111125 RepID=A0ABN9L510_9NEOB|nr:unnamed protein product [Ranitomeya imitator]